MVRKRLSTEAYSDMRGLDVTQDPHLVATLARGLQVLECLKHRNHQFMGNKEISEMTGLSRPTVSRITYTLSRFGYIKYVASLSKYTLGSSILAAAYPVIANMKIRQIARPLMQELANEVGGVVSLGLRHGTQMLFVESCASATSVTPVVAGIGARIPLLVTAMGRAYLCGLSGLEREQLISQLEQSRQFSKLELESNFSEALKQFDKWGFCLAKKGLVKETRSLGVPLLAKINDESFAFNCGIPTFRLSPNQLENEIGPRLLNLVRSVEKSIGIS
jgi:DNA-binding IclR family transcriptional regulator